MEGRVFITFSYVCVHELCRGNLADRTICRRRNEETARKHHCFFGKISRMLMNSSAVSYTHSMLSICCCGLWIVDCALVGLTSLSARTSFLDRWIDKEKAQLFLYLLIYNFYLYSYWSVRAFWTYQLKCRNVCKRDDIKRWTVTQCE